VTEHLRVGEQRVSVERENHRGAIEPEHEIDVASRHLPEIALVVTDVVMPRLGGIALVRRLRERRADLPVLLTSGYAPDGDVTASDLPMLDKPYTPDQLTRRIRDLLG